MTTKTIKLLSPILSGKVEITEITLRKPFAGDLRGIKLINFLDADVDSLVKVLPRISTPTLSEQDVLTMDLVDLSNVFGEIGNFFPQKSNSVNTESRTE